MWTKMKHWTCHEHVKVYLTLKLNWGSWNQSSSVWNNTLQAKNASTGEPHYY